MSPILFYIYLLMSQSVSLPFLTQKSSSRKNISIYSDKHSGPKLINRKPTESNRNFLLKSQERQKRGCMDTFRGSIGPKAKLDFIYNYKYRKEISDRNAYENLEMSPSAAYLEVIDSQKLNPLPFGIVRNKGKETELDIHGYCMGDNYAAAFSEGLKHCKSVEKINLRSNRLSEKGSTSILMKLDMHSIKDLCMSENSLGRASVRRIADILEDQKSNLRHLSLESVKLSDLAGNLIFEALCVNNTLTRLNLAKNSLSEVCCKSLRHMLISNSTLRRLDLHWNNLTGRGCALVFEGVEKNAGLLELDLSWNLMIRNLDTATITQISSILSEQKRLKHLDLSSNYLSQQYCEILAGGLKSNHDILGIHMSGNDCTVDSYGFIVSDPYISKVKQSHFMTRMLDDNSRFRHNTSDNCWICEKWVEVKFYWSGGGVEPVCIHLDCDNYQPGLMVKEGKSYVVTRAVPPGERNFFFSVGMNFMKSQDYLKKKLPENIEKEINFWESTKIHLQITNLNLSDAHGLVCNMKDPFKTKPRTPKLSYIPPPVEMEKIPWSISVSLFKDYKQDDDLLLTDCFDFDWAHSKIPNLIKDLNDLERTRSLLRKHYKVLRESYKTISAYSGSEIPCIGNNTFIELLGQSSVFDQQYGVNDFGVNWNTAVVPKIKHQVYNPANALVRYEFMEMIVRVAFDRYIRTKNTQYLHEAVESLLTDHMLPRLKELCSDSWRTEKYLCESVDVTLKAHKQIFDCVYKKFSGRKALPGQRPFMSLEEFRDLCTIAGLVNDNFSTREIDVCFAQAMMTQVDEIFKKRHIEMSYIEFLEAICRACELAGITKQNNELVGAYQTLTLQNKIENAASLLLKLCSLGVQENFSFPTSKTYEKMMFKPKGLIHRMTSMNYLMDE